MSSMKKIDYDIPLVGKLEVGKRYLTREGVRHRIQYQSADGFHSMGMFWQSTGAYLENSTLQHGFDLVAEFPDASPEEEKKIKGIPCGHCDFSRGTRGMDRCSKCDGTGSVFIVEGDSLVNFPNTEEGWFDALHHLRSMKKDKCVEISCKFLIIKAQFDDYFYVCYALFVNGFAEDSPSESSFIVPPCLDWRT